MADEKQVISHLESFASTDDYHTEKDHTNLSRVDSEVAKYSCGARVFITPEENRRLKRLVDKRVLPIMIVTYILQALDKGTLSFASIMGLREDTDLQKQQVHELQFPSYPPFAGDSANMVRIRAVLMVDDLYLHCCVNGRVPDKLDHPASAGCKVGVTLSGGGKANYARIF